MSFSSPKLTGKLYRFQIGLDETEAVCSLSEPKEEVIEDEDEEVSADVPTVGETEEEDAE